MLRDGVRDGGLLALRQRDIAADDALQLGEFAHRLRHQVGLGEMGRARRAGSIRAHVRRKLPRQKLDSQDTLKLRAELLVEGHLAQQFSEAIERPLAVIFPKELGIRQPRANHALVAGHDGLAAVSRLQIGDKDEPVGQFP